MKLISCYTTSLNFNFYVPSCGNNVLKQKTAHLSMACYVHVLENRRLCVNASQLS
jgi:hypothetical protein